MQIQQQCNYHQFEISSAEQRKVRWAAINFYTVYEDEMIFLAEREQDTARSTSRPNKQPRRPLSLALHMAVCAEFNEIVMQNMMKRKQKLVDQTVDGHQRSQTLAQPDITQQET
uniref:Tyrosine-protein phosphatase domain-containing protein n=1 Tax=Ascaris lumbricoides TaxID=6252 RepID=A0A0M3IDK4_ASCLU